MMRKMRVLITGINGFIGYHVAQKYAKMGHEVIGLDKNSTNDAYKTYAVDMLNSDLPALLTEIAPNLIIHCAGLANVSYSLQYPDEDFMANTYMVYHFLESMRKAGLGNCRFLFLSSAAVYGQPVKLPVCEEDTQCPMSPYALHKKMAEEICTYYITQYQFDIRILRIFSTYGPGLKKQVFWDMHQKLARTGKLELFGTGNESRDYIYIDDLTEAICLIAADERNDYFVWNVANGTEVTIREIAEIFVDIKGIPRDKVLFNGAVREGDPMNWCANIDRLVQLGYKQKVSIVDGVKAYVDWVKSERYK